MPLPRPGCLGELSLGHSPSHSEKDPLGFQRALCFFSPINPKMWESDVLLIVHEMGNRGEDSPEGLILLEINTTLKII